MSVVMEGAKVDIRMRSMNHLYQDALSSGSISELPLLTQLPEGGHDSLQITRPSRDKSLRMGKSTHNHLVLFEFQWDTFCFLMLKQTDQASEHACKPRCIQQEVTNTTCFSPVWQRGGHL